MFTCDYCGTERPDETAPCPVCGTPAAESPDEAQGQPGRSGSVSGAVSCAVGVAAVAGGHLGGMFHVLKGLLELGSTAGENSPHGLLEHAADLESVDMRQAIAQYEQIALHYPGTPEAEEANRNAQTLRAAHPELEDLPGASPKDWLP